MVTPANKSDGHSSWQTRRKETGHCRCSQTKTCLAPHGRAARLAEPTRAAAVAACACSLRASAAAMPVPPSRCPAMLQCRNSSACWVSASSTRAAACRCPSSSSP